MHCAPVTAMFQQSTQLELQIRCASITEELGSGSGLLAATSPDEDSRLHARFAIHEKMPGRMLACLQDSTHQRYVYTTQPPVCCTLRSLFLQQCLLQVCLLASIVLEYAKCDRL